ncbi:4-hydroxy-3-methylbut-2-enyl diphosphate reductase [Sphaerobacter thermophilus]|uniref:4-hydroxy-3-methylbut-2-enyl diphosphate reductase n=1 Tax=Sphaerobacter thermophilus (strain ATCC 49802 / DSM 20745 / KCCM 41009 / NCIMB 13125 / S 6022) TaxID=479434 RepID=D1C708_SPHTD|nr:4-hydroxy-3-methylbut-2-enyl diphosphate reductase [Sphaerobacter thermophilus]ACZ37769.1 hydroxymethylbutenyl pyrophosphate reductase [Sphaerobacter thermophilus DSM 20745]
MTRRIVMAEELGYCWGVRRALEIITEAGDPNNPVATIGDVIHNPQVVQRLKARGVDTAESVEEAAQRGFRRVAITAHGAGPERARLAAEHGLELIDTTCPLVTKVQRLGQKLVRQGYFLVVYGDSFHPEVRGVLAWAETSRAVAAKHIEDLPWNAPRGSTDPDAKVPPRKVAVVSQTTKNVDEFMEFVTQLTSMVARDGGEIRVCNTICEPTSERQNALRRLAGEVDLILAIGGKKSSNTARLAEVGRSYGVPSYHIESEAEIEPAWLDGVEVVGVTAGASTPDDVIEGVVDWLVGQGFAPPEDGIRYRDLDDVPAY